MDNAPAAASLEARFAELWLQDLVINEGDAATATRGGGEDSSSASSDDEAIIPADSGEDEPIPVDEMAAALTHAVGGVVADDDLAGVAAPEPIVVCKAGCKLACVVHNAPIALYRAEMKLLHLTDARLHKLTVQALLYACRLSSVVPTRAGKRVRNRWLYRIPHVDARLCKHAFIHAAYVGPRTLKTLQSWVKRYNNAPYQHGATGIARATLRDVVYPLRLQHLGNWLKEFVEDNSLVLPWRVNATVTHALPPSFTYSSIHRMYCDAALAMFGTTYVPIQLTVFRRVFKQSFPHVTKALRRTDVCDYCHSATYLVQRAVATSEGPDAVQTRLDDLHKHLDSAKTKRQQHNSDVEQYSGWEKCWETDTVVLCFDYAQNISLPHHPSQPGQLFFKTPYKVGLFGIWNSATDQMSMFFVEESISASIGKGSDATIAFLHHYLRSFSLKHEDGRRKTPKRIIIWCDNCTGQNKNNMLMQYCAFRVSSGLNSFVSVNFMLPGHTKFVCDRFFGVFKRAWHNCEADTVVQAMAVCAVASPDNRLIAVDASDIGMMFKNWQSRFQGCTAIPSIKSHHHFRFLASTPWIAWFSDDMLTPGNSWSKVSLLAPRRGVTEAQLNLPFDSLPDIEIVLLPAQRRWYLYKDIGPYVHHAVLDTVDPWIKPPEPYERYESERVKALKVLATGVSGEAAAAGGPVKPRGRPRKTAKPAPQAATSSKPKTPAKRSAKRRARAVSDSEDDDDDDVPLADDDRDDDRDDDNKGLIAEDH